MASSQDHLAKSQRFLRTARWALSDGDFDSCVSRAEYAAHHAQVALLLRYGRPASAVGWSKHQLRTDFERLTVRQYSWLRDVGTLGTRRGLGTSLTYLSAIRERADYLGTSVTRSEAGQALQFVERLLILVQEHVE